MPAATDSKPERTGYELRLLIHHKVAGAVIGKGGENIKKLREHEIDDVTIPDRQSPERVVIILAKSLDIIKKCLKEVSVKIDEVNHKVLNSTNSEIRLLVHSSHGGAIIGKGGANVKELKEKTGCQIKVYTELCPYSTDRVVAVQGEREQVVDCVTEIVRICRDNPVKTTWRKYDTANYNIYFADKYGGYADFAYRGGGGQGASAASLQAMQMQMQHMGFRDQAMYDMGSYGAPPAGGGGMYQQMGGGMSMGQAYGYANGGGGDMYAKQMAGAGDYYRGMGGPVESIQLTVPEEVTGAVIGRRGDKIRSIKMDSGADISLDRDSNVDGEKLITVTGNPNQVQMATFLLQQAVRNSPQGRKLLGKTGISN